MKTLGKLMCAAALAMIGQTVPTLAQAGPSPDAILAVTTTVDDRVGGVVAGPMLQTAKATYLEGYGLVVTVEVALELPRNPFSGLRPIEEIRQSSQRRHRALKEQVLNMVRELPPRISGLAPDDKFAVIVYMLNTNPVDLPDLPTQFVAAVARRDTLELESAAISEAVFAARVRIQEY